MATIEFWYEFASTYSYPAAMRVEKIADASGVMVSWQPFLLGPIFKTQGWSDSPFNIYPAKGAYMWRDMERICQEQDLSFLRPDKFPQNGLVAARLACCPEVVEKIAEFTRLIYQVSFAENKDISDKNVLYKILMSLGVDPDLAYHQAASQEVKNDLRMRGDIAVKKQIFGAPSFVTPDGELFWGNDRLEQAVAWASR